MQVLVEIGVTRGREEATHKSAMHNVQQANIPLQIMATASIWAAVQIVLQAHTVQRRVLLDVPAVHTGKLQI
jgi:hypothetical protein